MDGLPRRRRQRGSRCRSMRCGRLACAHKVVRERDPLELRRFSHQLAMLPNTFFYWSTGLRIIVQMAVFGNVATERSRILKKVGVKHAVLVILGNIAAPAFKKKGRKVLEARCVARAPLRMCAWGLKTARLCQARSRKAPSAAALHSPLVSRKFVLGLARRHPLLPKNVATPAGPLRGPLLPCSVLMLSTYSPA